MKTNQFKQLFVFLILIFVSGNCFADAASNRELFLKRMRIYGKQVQAEIDRKHELEMEVAKHQVALDLEAAGSDQLTINNSVSSSSDSSSVAHNRQVNN